MFYIHFTAVLDCRFIQLVVLAIDVVVGSEKYTRCSPWSM